MSDIVSLNGYKIKDEKAVRSYETVALMKADTKLKEGYHVKTKGYYEANDGGNGEYVIVNDDTLVSDNGSIHVLNNGLRAELIVKDYITPELFGAKGDGETDDTSIIEIALNYIKDKNIELKLNNTYKITSEITINNSDTIKINGNNSTLKVLTNVALYFSTINNLIIEDLNVIGSLSNNTVTGALAHTLNAKNVTINNINAKYLEYVYKNDYQLTNDPESQFVSDNIKFTNIYAEDCTCLIITAFVENLVCENIFSKTPNEITRELFYLEGGIVNSYFNNISADYLVRWAFHFNVSGAPITWDLTKDVNKNKNCYINNIIVDSAQYLLHFTSYCESVYVNNAKANMKLYESTANYTCENIYVSNSTIEFPANNSTGGAVNLVKLYNCNINGNGLNEKSTEFIINNCNWFSDIDTTYFFLYTKAGTVTVQNSKLINTSETANQCFQTNTGAKLFLLNNRAYFNKANRFVSIVDASDKVVINNNIIEASTSISGLNTGTAYISSKK